MTFTFIGDIVPARSARCRTIAVAARIPATLRLGLTKQTGGDDADRSRVPHTRPDTRSLDVRHVALAVRDAAAGDEEGRHRPSGGGAPGRGRASHSFARTFGRRQLQPSARAADDFLCADVL